MQIENWHIVVLLACIGSLYKIASMNQEFYEKVTSNLTKVICIIAAFSAGYFSRGETEIDTLWYILSFTFVPILMFILWLIGFVANELRSGKQ
jgi:CDP-diglyceride synthetase